MQPPSTLVLPIHPAYTDPILTGNTPRNPKDKGRFRGGDPDKATAMLFHNLANDSEPSLRVGVELDSNSGIKRKLKDVEADIAKHENWSDNLY